MTKHPFESGMSPADEDGKFREALETFIPQVASVSISQTFYQAGYAAALAQSQATLTKPNTTPQRSSLRWVATLAAGLVIGIAGYAVGVSKPRLMGIAQRTNPDVPVRDNRSENEVKQSQAPDSRVVIETSEVTTLTDEAYGWNASLPFIAYLLPTQPQALSMGSLPSHESQDAAMASTYTSPNSYRVALTSHPAASQNILSTLLAP